MTQAGDDVTEGRRLHVAAWIRHVELDGEAVLLDRRTGELHHGNPAAAAVLARCDGRTGADLVAALAPPAADGRPDRAEVLALLDRLIADGIVVSTETGPGGARARGAHG